MVVQILRWDESYKLQMVVALHTELPTCISSFAHVQVGLRPRLPQRIGCPQYNTKEKMQVAA